MQLGNLVEQVLDDKYLIEKELGGRIIEELGGP